MTLFEQTKDYTNSSNKKEFKMANFHVKVIEEKGQFKIDSVGKNVFKMRFWTVVTLCFILAFFMSCKTHKHIYIKEAKRGNPERLFVNTEFRKAQFGIVLLKPWALYFAMVEPIYKLTFTNEKSEVIWKVHSANNDASIGGIEYSKFRKPYEQDFPLDNKTPEPLKKGSKYLLRLETKKGAYEKTFLFQPGEIYILEEDKKN